MKNKNIPNIIFIISMLIYTGMAIEVIVVRNFIALGIWQGLVIAGLYTLAIACLVIAAYTKKKLLAIICRITVISWQAYVFITSFTSANEDATILSIISTTITISAMVFGVLRHNVQGKNS